MSQVISHLRIILDLLSVFGINAFSPGRSTRTQCNWKLWSYFVLASQTAVLCGCVFYRNFFLRSDLSPVGMLLNLVHYTWMMSTSCSVILFSIASERGQLEFWQRLQTLRELRFQEEQQDICFFKALARKTLLLFLTLVTLNLSVFYFIAYDPQWTLYVLVGISSILINRMFCLRVLVCLEGIHCEVLAFERCLQVFVDSSSVSGVKEVHIAMAMDWHSAIVSAARRFLHLFNWSLFLIFLDGFLMLGVNFYWTYIHLICRKSLWSALTLFMVASLLLLALFVVLQSSQSVCEVHKRCTRLAGRLEAKENTEEMHSKINFLVLKMESEPIEFNILDFFKLDLALFAEMLFTIPSYMIIYSQFLE